MSTRGRRRLPRRWPQDVWQHREIKKPFKNSVLPFAFFALGGRRRGASLHPSPHSTDLSPDKSPKKGPTTTNTHAGPPKMVVINRLFPPLLLLFGAPTKLQCFLLLQPLKIGYGLTTKTMRTRLGVMSKREGGREDDDKGGRAVELLPPLFAVLYCTVCVRAGY